MRDVKKTVLCFGGEGIEGDDIAFRIYEELGGKIEGVRMVWCESAMDLLDYMGAENLHIMDAVRGLKRVSVFSGIESFRKSNPITTHDMDLGLFLHILDETEKMRKVKIIGIPIKSVDKKQAIEDVRKILSKVRNV